MEPYIYICIVISQSSHITNDVTQHKIDSEVASIPIHKDLNILMSDWLHQNSFCTVA